MTKQQQSKEYKDAIEYLKKELDRLNRENIEGYYKNSVVKALETLEEYDNKINSQKVVIF
jgi:hypothetical protein